MRARPKYRLGAIVSAAGLALLGLASPAAAADDPEMTSLTVSEDFKGDVRVDQDGVLLSADSAAVSTLAGEVATMATSVKVTPGTPARIRVGAPNQVVLGNLTVTEPEWSGFTTAYSCTATVPNSSVNNYVAGLTIPNFAAVRADANGDICIHSSATTHVIWDQVIETTGLDAQPATRMFDTRGSAFTQPRLPAGAVQRLKVGAPNRTVMGNLTVVDPTGAGFTTAYPCAAGRPNSSVNNYVAGQVIPNFAAVRADANGEVCFYTTASAHLIWDQVIDTDAVAANTAVRVFDTRGVSGTNPRLAAGAVTRIKVGAPNRTVMGNLTVVDPTGAGFTTAYPCAAGRPNSSVNNYVAGDIIPNFAAVTADANGEVCFYATAATHLIWDQVVATDALTAHVALRKIDTRDRDADHFALLRDTAGRAFRWNPCVLDNELGVYVNWGASAAEAANMQTAIERVAETSGLPLVFKGSTTVLPTSSNQRGMPGDASYHAPLDRDITVAFSRSGVTDVLPGGSVAGIGGAYSWTLTTGDWNEAFYGYAVFDEQVMANLPSNQRVAIYMHEIGHALGLGHYDDARQVMRSTILNTSTFWGNGDSFGLGVVGTRSSCFS